MRQTQYCDLIILLNQGWIQDRGGSYYFIMSDCSRSQPFLLQRQRTKKKGPSYLDPMHQPTLNRLCNIIILRFRGGAMAPWPPSGSALILNHADRSTYNYVISTTVIITHMHACTYLSLTTLLYIMYVNQIVSLYCIIAMSIFRIIAYLDLFSSHLIIEYI